MNDEEIDKLIAAYNASVAGGALRHPQIEELIARRWDAKLSAIDEKPPSTGPTPPSTQTTPKRTTGSKMKPEEVEGLISSYEQRCAAGSPRSTRMDDLVAKYRAKPATPAPVAAKPATPSPTTAPTKPPTLEEFLEDAGAEYDANAEGCSESSHARTDTSVTSVPCSRGRSSPMWR